ncbi:MAG: hypothetical protein AB8G05_16820, partial [Oligoflexales bacterium]
FKYQTRKEIRAALKNVLSGKTKAGDRVGINVDRLDESMRYPYIDIYTPEEKSEIISNSVLESANTLSVSIEVTAVQTEESNVLDVLDGIGLEIEQRLQMKSEVNDFVPLLTLSESRIGKSEEGSKPIGRLILSYECEYTKDLMPDVPENLPPFKVVSTDWRN